MENQQNNQPDNNPGASGAQKHSANPIVANDFDRNIENYGFNPGEARNYDSSGMDNIPHYGGAKETGRYDDSKYDHESDYDGEDNATGENAKGSGSEINNSTNTAGNSGNDPNEYGSH
jgi:hypothetical protein